MLTLWRAGEDKREHGFSSWTSEKDEWEMRWRWRQGPSGHFEHFGLYPECDKKSSKGLKAEDALWGWWGCGWEEMMDAWNATVMGQSNRFERCVGQGMYSTWWLIMGKRRKSHRWLVVLGSEAKSNAINWVTIYTKIARLFIIPGKFQIIIK